MEKLVELLNKFEKEKIINEGGYVDEDDEYFGRSLEGGDIVNRSFDRDAHGFFKYQIISKDFKFIERLVDNNKIDQTNKFCVSVNVEGKGMGYTKAFESYESLLMLLSIQDEPIEFLISILK